MMEWSGRDQRASDRLGLLCDVLDEHYNDNANLCKLCYRPQGPFHQACLAQVGALDDLLDVVEQVARHPGVCSVCRRGGWCLVCTKCDNRVHRACAEENTVQYTIVNCDQVQCSKHQKQEKKVELHTDIVWIRAKAWSRRFRSRGVVGSCLYSLELYKKVQDSKRPRFSMKRQKPRKSLYTVKPPVFLKRKQRNRQKTQQIMKRALTVLGMESKDDKKFKKQKACQHLTLDSFPSLKAFYSK